jgi:hypothetical protein
MSVLLIVGKFSMDFEILGELRDVKVIATGTGFATALG